MHPPPICLSEVFWGCPSACTSISPGMHILQTNGTEFHQTLADHAVEKADELIVFRRSRVNVKVKVATRSGMQNFGGTAVG